MIEQDLKNLIIERYSSLSRFAEIIDMPWTTLDGVLKRGVNKANITSLIKICNGLNIDCESLYYGRILPKQDLLNTTPLSSNELEHIKKYRSLDKYGIKQVDCVLDNEYDRCVKEQEAKYTILKPNYLTGLSAGTGLYVFDDVPCEQIEVPIEYEDIDFVIGITGDSMEPDYHDGEQVMIKKGEVRVGEVGAFMYDGEAFIKVLGNHKLISLNKDYPDKEIDDSTQFDVIGKVIGKI